MKITELKVNTKYIIVDVMKYTTNYGPAILLTFHEEHQRPPVFQKIWIPRRISKVILQTDESYQIFAVNVKCFVYLGTTGNMSKLDFNFTTVKPLSERNR